MKIISRYVLREHLGPFVFAATALTSIMLLQFIARRFGDLVGKGLPWQMILEFFLLSIPFTVAMTLPMAVLVAVLYAFSRLASENEITALRAGGVSTRRLMVPVFGAAGLLAIGMVYFNDQVLPRANHRLATLQLDIFRAKPTFALREQVINTVKEGQLYLRAGKLDEGSAQMREVVIYDLSDPSRRRTIYADSGVLQFAPNQRDLLMTLFDGVMQSAPTETPEELTRLYYRRNVMTVEGVATGPITASSTDSAYKGDREMTVCEMQREVARYEAQYQLAEHELERIRREVAAGRTEIPQIGDPPPDASLRISRSLGWAYCALLSRFPKSGVKPLHAAVVTPAQAPPPVQRPAQPARPPAVTPRPGLSAGPAPSPAVSMLESTARMQLDDARRSKNRYQVEIHKKFSLAVACLVFVMLGAPIALRFPRGGVGLVLGVSFGIFALYYVGLIGGEALADRGIVSPWLSMWGTNILFALIALVFVARMGRETATARGGDMGELLITVRSWAAKQGRRIGLPLDRRRTR